VVRPHQAGRFRRSVFHGQGARNRSSRDPFIRYIAAKQGLTATQFTLLGRNFSSTLANNRVEFFKPGSTVVQV